MRVRFEIIGSAASHIEINFMCQDLRMEIVRDQIDLNTHVKDHLEKGRIRLSRECLITGVSYFAF
jgi:hypothetical protein